MIGVEVQRNHLLSVFPEEHPVARLQFASMLPVYFFLVLLLTLGSSKIVQQLNIPWAVLLSQDSFYKVLSPMDSIKADNSEYNFDHPGKVHA